MYFQVRQKLSRANQVLFGINPERLSPQAFTASREEKEKRLASLEESNRVRSLIKRRICGSMFMAANVRKTEGCNRLGCLRSDVILCLTALSIRGALTIYKQPAMVPERCT